MMKKIRFPVDPSEPFRTGQVWGLADSCLRIGDVGHLLVYYRRYQGKDPRGPSSVTSKRELETYLKAHKAILVK